MAKIRFYFLFGVLKFLCCHLTSANTTSPAVTSSVSHPTISPSSVHSGNFSTSQLCSTQSCINATVTVSATGNAHASSSVAVQSSCSMIFVGCVADASNSTTPLITSPIAETSAAASTIPPLSSSIQTSFSVVSQQTSSLASSLAISDSSTPATDLLSTSTPSTNSTDVAAIPSPSSTTAAATITVTATGTVASANATDTTSGSSQTTSLAPSPSISSTSITMQPASPSQTSSSNNSTASGNQSSTASSSSPSMSPSASPSSSSFTSTQSVSQNQTSTVSPSTANTTVVPSTSAVVQPPTSPPKTKSVTIKVTFDIPFKEEYRNRESEAYKDLEKNFTEVLTVTFKKMDGFIRVVILSLREGSVICDFDVIFNETGSPNPEDVKKTIQEASKNGELGGYAVTKIEVEGERKNEEKKDELPLWAFVTLILLGALGVVLLIIVIILAVLLKRTKESGPGYRVTGEDWAHYETMSMGDYKVRAEEVDRGRHRSGNRNNQPIYENHPTSHSNLTYQVPANGE